MDRVIEKTKTQRLMKYWPYMAGACLVIFPLSIRKLLPLKKVATAPPRSSGPTGTVNLVWLPEYTKFANMEQ